MLGSLGHSVRLMAPQFVKLYVKSQKNDDREHPRAHIQVLDNECMARPAHTVNVREVLNGIFYVLSTGCQWNALPTDLPPKSTIYDYLDLWDWDGTLERIHYTLYLAVREQAGRDASPTVAIIDAQSAKGAQKGGRRSIRRAMTQARRSRVASATFSSTRSASC